MAGNPGVDLWTNSALPSREASAGEWKVKVQSVCSIPWKQEVFWMDFKMPVKMSLRVGGKGEGGNTHTHENASLFRLSAWPSNDSGMDFFQLQTQFKEQIFGCLALCVCFQSIWRVYRRDHLCTENFIVGRWWFSLQGLGLRGSSAYESTRPHPGPLCLALCLVLGALPSDWVSEAALTFLPQEMNRTLRTRPVSRLSPACLLPRVNIIVR